MIYCCPNCESLNIKKNGHSKNKKQQYRCNNCGRGFVENPESRKISDDTKEKIKRALLERNSLRGICRIFSVSLTWLLGFAERLYQETADNLGFELGSDVDIDLQILETEADEMWSFVKKKRIKYGYGFLWIGTLGKL